MSGRNKRGIASVWFAISGLALIGLFAWVIDTAHGGPIKLILGSFWGTPTSSQMATATAYLIGPQPGLLLLDIDQRNEKDVLRLKGDNNANIIIKGGSIIVNSGNAEAATLQG